MKILLAFALLAVPTALTGQAPSSADLSALTAAGVQYVRPANWTATTADAVTLFVSPEGDLRAALVDVGSAADARAAADRAWVMRRSGDAPAPRLVTASAPAEGWDERASLAYETNPAERVVRTATALRKGAGWTVLIVEGSAGTAAKRAAALSVLGDLHPAGYAAESFAGRTAHPLTPERVRLLREFAEQSARELGVPGVGLALIDHGRVVWQGGIGVRALGRPEPVDEHTRFMVASNTKGMTTLLLSTLADAGKLRWDQPVTELYPAFRLGDEATTRSVLVRHLVCACTGLPRKDFEFILADAGAPASDTFRQLARTQPTSRFGELFQYSNLLASAAGYVGGALAHPGMELGRAYDRAMQERVFGPLGMKDTTFDAARGMAGNWAPPHGLDVDGRMVRMSNGFNAASYPLRPAGTAYSTTADMARYVQLELNRGVTPEGRRVVSTANLLERRKPGVQVDKESYYGMGLFTRTMAGIPVVMHGGTLQGYHSNWYALPGAGVGAVVLTNADGGQAMLAPFLRRLLEVLYDGRPEAARDVTSAAARIRAQAAAKRARLTWPGDPAVLAGLASHYRDAQVGQITVSDRDGGKWIRAGFIEGPLATRRNLDGSVSVVSVGPGNIGFDALVGTREGKRTLTLNDGQQNQYVYIEGR